MYEKFILLIMVYLQSKLGNISKKPLFRLVTVAALGSGVLYSNANNDSCSEDIS